MKKLDLSKYINIKPDPLFKGLAVRLKDPKNFENIEKKLIEVLKIDHEHKTASSYVKCKECNEKREQRKKLIKEQGFKSLQQYYQWKKIHTIIRDQKSFQVR